MALSACKQLWKVQQNNSRFLAEFVYRNIQTSRTNCQEGDVLGICAEQEGQFLNKNEYFQQQLVEAKQNIEKSSFEKGTQLEHSRAVFVQSMLRSISDYQLFKDTLIKRGMYDSKLFTIGLEAAMKYRFGCDSMAKLMDAVATVRHYDNMTCLRFARAIEKKIDMFTADSVATVLVSLAKLGYKEKFPYEHLAYSYMLPDTFAFQNHQNVTNVCFAMAFAGIWMPQFWDQISQEFKKLKSSGFTSNQLRLLSLVQLSSDVEGAQVFQLPHKLSINCYNALLVNRRIVPDFRGEVVLFLKQFGYDVEIDKMIEEGLYADIAIKHNQDGQTYNVALLICGPECYSQNPVYQPNGEIQLLQRLILYKGWKTGLISSLRWEEQRSVFDKQAYVKDKVRKTIQYSHHGKETPNIQRQISKELLGNEDN